MRLVKLQTKILRLTFDEEPVTKHGRLFVPRSGEKFMRIRRALYEPGLIVPGAAPNPLGGLGGGLVRLRPAAADITASGMFVATWIDIMDTTQLAVDLDLETHKMAIFGSTVTPNFSSDTAYGVAPYNSGEITGTGWAAGGEAVTGTTWLEDPTGTIEWDATDLTSPTTTFTGGEGGLVYADALAGDNAILLHDWGTTASPNAGTFTAQWAAGGLVNVDVTP